MSKYDSRIVRFSLDLDIEQKNFLRLYAAKAELSASIILRAMIHILQTDQDFSDQVLDLIFYTPEVPIGEEDEGEDIDG